MAQVMQSVERVRYDQYIAALSDAHCHLDLFDDPASVVNEAFSKGVSIIITSGGGAKSNEATSELSKRLGVYGVVGIDPDNGAQDSGYVEKLHSLITSNVHLVGIGEIGLDAKMEEKFGPKEQKELFVKQIGIANELGIPVVIHSRGRIAEVIKIVDKNPPERAMFHFFEGDADQAKDLIDRGYIISIPPRDDARRKRVINESDIRHIVAETDAPVAGKTPAEVRGVVETISSIKGMDFSEVAERLTDNVKGLFHV